MTQPTIPVTEPKDDEIIGEGAEKIRETRQALYDIFPIKPDDLDYQDTSNYWPAGSLTGGVDPAVPGGSPPGDAEFQDRAFLIGQKTLQWDYEIPEGHNAISPGPIDASSVTVDVPDGSTWTVVGDEDLNVQYLRDLDDVDVASSNNGDALIYDSVANSWYSHPAPEGPEGPVGPIGPPGPEGPKGDASTVPGPTGPQGPEGPKGDASTVAGPPGPKGDPGEKGADGDVGPEGPEGPEGPDGTPGTGIQFKGTVNTSTSLPGWPNSYGGETGDAYATDDTGDLWVWGEDGAWHNLGQIQGPEGPTGPEGPAGGNGTNGTDGDGWTSGSYNSSNGIVTFTSDDGLGFTTGDLRGSTGGQGPEGPEGPQGEQGDKGDKGDKGDPGTTPDMSTYATKAYSDAGDVTTLDDSKAYTDAEIAGIPAGKTYKLETDANLRATPQIQLVDENDMFSDVAMVAGTGMSITSGASSMTFDSTTYNLGLSGTDILLNDSDGGDTSVSLIEGDGITLTNVGNVGVRITSDVVGGVQLNNTQTWTYGQYNEQKADASKSGSGISTRYSWDAEAKPVMSLSDNAVMGYVASPYPPTVNGMFISITWVSYGGGQVWSFSDAFDSKLGPPEDTGDNVTRIFHSRFNKWCDVA